MIADYFEYTGNKSFLHEFLPYAEMELEWWHKNRSIEVEKDGQKHGMFQYKVSRTE
jgi:glycogen debranching enzyme